MLALFDAPAAGAAVGFAMWDERLRYVALSDSLAAVHGHPADESLGRPPRDVVPALAEELEPILRDVLESGEPRLDIELGGHAGESRTWLGSYYPLRDAGSAVVGGIVVEITDRKRAELALREAHGLARMGGWTWYVRERRADWSDELFRVFGMPGPDAPTLEEWSGLLVPEDRDDLLRQLLHSIRTGDPFDVHFRFRRPSGIVRHIRAAGDAPRGPDGDVTALHGFAQDVTEARRAEAQQRAVAELGQFALSGGPLDELFDRAVEVVADVMLVEQTVLTERLPDGRFLVRAGRGWRDGAVGSLVVSRRRPVRLHAHGRQPRDRRGLGGRGALLLLPAAGRRRHPQRRVGAGRQRGWAVRRARRGVHLPAPLQPGRRELPAVDRERARRRDRPAARSRADRRARRGAPAARRAGDGRRGAHAPHDRRDAARRRAAGGDGRAPHARAAARGGTGGDRARARRGRADRGPAARGDGRAAPDGARGGRLGDRAYRGRRAAGAARRRSRRRSAWSPPRPASATS